MLDMPQVVIGEATMPGDSATHAVSILPTSSLSAVISLASASKVTRKGQTDGPRRCRTGAMAAPDVTTVVDCIAVA